MAHSYKHWVSLASEVASGKIPVSVWVRRAASARGKVVLTCVYCVRNYIPTTTTAETTFVTLTWFEHAPSADVIHNATRRGTFNTAGATARFIFHAQPDWYSRSAFQAWKARLVVRADRGTVCFGERHIGRDEILLCNFTPRQQICGGGGGCHNQPPHPQAVMRESKLCWLDVCHSPRSSESASSWCTRRWVTGGQPSSSGTSVLSPARQYHPIFSALCGQIACCQIFRPLSPCRRRLP